MRAGLAPAPTEPIGVGVAQHPSDSLWDLFSQSSSAHPVPLEVLGTPLLSGVRVRAVRRQRLQRTEEQL